MKHWPCDQNGETWERLRKGMVTASAMEKIVCPEMATVYRCADCGRKFTRSRKACDCGGAISDAEEVVRSKSATSHMFRLIAESLGPVQKQMTNYWQDRGHELEPKCVAMYGAMTGRDTELVGFCTTDDGLIGASPDRFVESDGMLEAKCPAPWVHLEYLATPGKLSREYHVQTQAQLLVCAPDRTWVDLVSYSEWTDGTPLPLVIERVERDGAFIAGMNPILVEFITELQRTRAELLAKYGDFSRQIAEAAADPMGVSQYRPEVEYVGRTERW